jgi:prephenate dehydratase
MKRAAYLGPEGTVSEEAARYFFEGTDVELVPCKVISDVFLATVNGRTDWSVIPIENTIEGSVSLHVDWLVHNVDLPIRAEWVYPSVQHLIGRRSVPLDKIEKIISHPVALPQCRHFLESHFPDVEYEHASSTAEGVRIVKANPDKPWAAVGTRLAAERNGLDILHENIMDHNDNYTRFILVGPEPVRHKPAERYKTSLLVTLPEDYPGALHQVLSAFAWRRINLSKIESRPTKKKLGTYFFFIDVEESMDSVLLPAALSEIEAIGAQVRILGSYPSYAFHGA